MSVARRYCASLTRYLRPMATKTKKIDWQLDPVPESKDQVRVEYWA